MGIEFGEKLLYKKKKGPKMEKLNPRWEYGIFVGLRRRSNEIIIIIIATEGGLEDARSVKRIPEANRWSVDSLSWVKWAPWRRYKDAVDADGDLPEGVPAEEIKRSEDKPGGLVFVNTRESAPREFHISKKDADKHGYIRGCGGCSSFTRGLGRQSHMDECRERFIQAMCQDAKVRNSEVKRREYEERQGVNRKKKEEEKEQSKLRRKRRRGFGKNMIKT